MEKLRKIFVVSVMLVTVLSMCVVVAPQAGATAKAGDLIKMSGLSSVYFLAADGKRYVFPNESTYFSWYSDFSGVVTIPQSELETYPLGANVTVRPGTKLVKITTDPKVYAVEPNGNLKHVATEAAAITLWGTAWAKRVIDVSDAFFTNYKIASGQVTATAYPTGSLIKLATGADIFYINADGTASKIASEAAFLANRFKWTDVITSTLAIPTAGADITGAVSTLTDTSSGAGGAAGAGTGLTVALASDTPGATTYIRDTGALVAQAVAGFTKINFTASSDGDVAVNTLKLTRSGISADTDLSKVYLYDGDTQIAENTSFSSKIVTFSNSAGLFTVTKGTTKSITVKADIAAVNATVSGIILGVNAAADVTTNGAAVSGTFPINGNQMAVGTVTDLGYANIVSSANANFPATMDPGKTNEELWRFNVTANDQDMMVEKIKMTLVGTIATTDVANFKMEVGGVQIGSTVASMNAGKEVMFDLSSAPYKITSGQTKTIVVKGDVLNGSGRAFKFTIRKVGDFIVKDNSYGIYVAPLVGGAAFTLIDANAASDGTNINNGNITVGIATDSPSGNVSSAATNVPLVKATYKANGEDVKVNYIRVLLNEEAGDKNLRNGKLYWNGSQVGSTDPVVDDENTTATALAYTVNQVITAGQTADVEYRADIIDNATGAGIAADQTIVISLSASSSGDATGQASLADVTLSAVTGRTLTVKTGLLSVAKNVSMADYTTSLPTGVAGATNVKVGSFVLTAGAGEAVTITQLTVGDLSGGSAFGSNFQNLVLKNGATALAPVKGTLDTTAGADYAFSLSPAVKINAGQQLVVDCYADILSSATGFSSAAVGLEFVSASATGDTTSADATTALSATSIQNVVIGSAGTMTLAVDGDSPLSQQIVMGSTGNEVAKFKFTETSNAENVTITAITLTDTVSAAATGSIANLVITDGVTTYGTAASLASGATAAITLTSPITVPKGSNKIITVKSDVTAYPNAISKSTHVFSISAFTARGESSGTTVSTAASSGTAGTMTAVRTKLTIAKGAAGTASRAADTVIANFTLTNSANVANQAAALSDVAINISTSGGTWTTTSKVINIYKNSVASANKVGSFNGLASVALGGWNNGSAGQYDDNPVASSTKDISISAGSSVTLIVAADTTGAPTGAGVTGAISVTIPATSGVTWEDGISTGSSAVTTVDTLPLTVSLAGI